MVAPAIAPDFECGLFWDYENISLARGMDGAETSNRLREVCLRFGRLIERRVYHDPEKVNSVQHGNRSALDTAGFTLVDCPARNLKETIDKKIIVDVMLFALTRVARQQPACIVLVTNDGDYAYMLSRLRDLQVRCIVIYTEGHAAAALLTACDLALTWKSDVLRLDGESEGAHATPMAVASQPSATPRILADVQRKAQRRMAKASMRAARGITSWSASMRLRGPGKPAAGIARRKQSMKLPSKMMPRRQAKRSEAPWSPSEQQWSDTLPSTSAAHRRQEREATPGRGESADWMEDAWGGFEFDEWEDHGTWTERRGKSWGKKHSGRDGAPSIKRDSRQQLSARGKAVRKGVNKGAKKGKGGKNGSKKAKSGKAKGGKKR